MKDKTVCIVGLGYVGLPLANAFSKHFSIIGFDIDEEKIRKLNKNFFAPQKPLLKTIIKKRQEKNEDSLEFTTAPSGLKQADFVLICVPTPVMKSKEPDLRYVKSAAEIIGKNLKRGAIVVLESTVYPGVTEEVVKPILDKGSGMKCGIDFKIGYSPERINTGDEEHDLTKITKIVAGMDKETTENLAGLYGLITNVYKVADIKTAEAAKVIENIQRDLNIALMNELTLIFHKMNLDTKAVLKAASTKWNFHRYSPGLVGGHCIPVDPYYLVYKAKELGYHPQVILAGRAINDYMPKHVAEMSIKGLNEVGKVIKGSKVLIMGLTYKKNVPDTRESPVREIVKELKEFCVEVYGYDPLLSKEEIEWFGVKALDELNVKVDCVIIAVAHDAFKMMTIEDIEKFTNDNPVLIDVQGIFDGEDARKNGFYYETL